MRALAILAMLAGLGVSADAQTPSRSANTSVKKAHAEIIKAADLEPGILRVFAFLAEKDRPIVHIVIAVRSATGETVQARTDAKGVATIGNLKPNGKYKVEALIQNEMYGTAQFTMPADAGMSVALSPVPVKGAAGAKGDGRPPPSRMHGIMRGQEGDDAGTLTVRVLRGSWNHNAAKIKVHLVGYHHSGKITHHTAVTDGGGRARFSKLDRSRNTAYYAFAVMQRVNKDAVGLKDKPHEGYDRLTSRTIQLPPKVGGRMILAASKPDDVDVAWDNNIDLFGDRTWPVPQPGEVHVEVSGGRNSLGKLELLKVGGKDVEAIATVSATRPLRRGVKLGRTGVIPMNQLPEGTVYIRVTRPEQMMARNPRPIPGAKVTLVDASTNTPVAGKVVGSASVYTNLKKGGIYSWKLEVFGRTFDGKSFEVGEGKGVFIPVPVDFQSTSPYRAVFKGLTGSSDAVYYVRAKRGGKEYISRPFQLTPTKGAFSKLDISRRIRYAFDFRGELDDDRIIFQGQFIVANVSWFPYKPKSGQYIFNLPKGFKGETVHGGMEAVVKKVRGKGFGWAGALPPRGASFRGAWIVKVEDGEMRFDMDLPNGAVTSKFQLKHVEGMKVKMYGNMKGNTVTDRRGNKWFTLNNLSIAPGQAIVMDVSGLPKPPEYKKYLRWAVGGIVFSILVLGLWGVFRARAEVAVPSAGVRLSDRREALLDNLVALERRHSAGDVDDPAYAREKSALVSDLESVYQQIDKQKTAAK